MGTFVQRIRALGLLILVPAVQALLESGVVKSLMPAPRSPAQAIGCIDWPGPCPGVVV